MAQRVRGEVRQLAGSVGHRQSPAYYDEGADEVCLAGCAKGQLSEVAQSWAAIKDTPDIRTLEAFRRQYGAANPLFDRLAEARIEELKKLGSGPTSLPPQAPAARPTVVAGYEVERLSSITGSILSASNIRIDASKPDEGITSCARLCDGATGCTAFDVSVVYGKCTLYRNVEKKGSLGGYISGVRIGNQDPHTCSRR